MPGIKVTLPMVVSVCFFSLLILILVTIGFQNSNSGQSKNQNPNQNRAESALSGQSGKKGEKADPRMIPPTAAQTSPAPKGDPDQGIPDPQSITSCSVAMEILPSPRPTKQWIYPHGNSTKVEVLCDFQVDGGGWTVIQKRSSGPRQEFSQNWNEYSNGFGSLDGNFWIGLKKIRALTKDGDQELRIDLEDFEGNKKYAKYSNFSISDASDFYRLAISGFSGDSTAGDSMTSADSVHSASIVLNGMRFSTKDKDNDLYHGGSCVNEYGGGGGWWFNYCGWSSHLNGLYRQRGDDAADNENGIIWHSWKGQGYSLAKTEMKIRRKKYE